MGNNLAVSSAGFALTGAAAGNYTVTQPTGLLASIMPRPLSIDFSGHPVKTYDGSTAATLTSTDFTLSGFIGSQSAVISQSPARYASKDAGSVVAVTAHLEPSDFTVNVGTSLSNYSFPTSVSGVGHIDPAPLTGTIVSNPSKVYDATTGATLAPDNYLIYGVVPGENVSVSAASTTGTYGAANAGVQSVTASPTAAAFTAGSGTLLSNYVLPASFPGFGTITQRGVGLSATITGNPTRPYNGLTEVTLTPSDFTLSGFAGSDSAGVNQDVTGQFSSKNVGAQPVSASLAQADFTFTSGSASNYSFPVSALGTGTIVPAQLTASIINNPTKIYDGKTAAALTSANIEFAGFAPDEGATATPTTAFDYASANAGGQTITGTLTPGNYRAGSGTDLTNYVLATSAAGSGTILQAPLYVTGVKAISKVYTTTIDDVLNIAAAGLAGLVGSDVGSVSLNTSTSGSFAQANVGRDLAVSASGFSISGSQVGNYILQPIAGLSASITPAPLTLSGISAQSRDYNGTTDATLDSSQGSLNGVLGSDSVTFSFSGASATGTFSTANVGNQLAVSTRSYSIGGSSAGNYQLAQPAGLRADITPALLTAVITGSPTKVYDGSTSTTLTAADYTLKGFAPGQGASVPQSATANYVAPNAGTSLDVESTLVTSDFIASAGTNLSNYVLPSTGYGSNGVITSKVLDLTGTRVYDASTDAAASLFGNNGVLAGVNRETLTLTGTGTLSTRNAGPQQAFAAGALSGYTLTGNNGALTGNYTLTGGTDWVTITPALVSVSGTTATDKTYDGNTTAQLSGAALDGVLSANGTPDSVTLGNTSAGTFNNKNVGTSKPVSTGFTLAGADAANYIVQQTSGLTASIGTLGITVTATGNNKQYDGTTRASVLLASTDILGGDHVTFAAASATFGQSDVGNGIVVSATGITDSGADAGNYTFNTTASTSASITPRILNLTATRVYDASTDAAASLFGSSGVLTGVAGQTLTLSGTGTLSTRNVGSKNPFATGGVSAFTLTGNGGALASNYTLADGTDWVSITRALLTVTGTTAAGKTYDGNTVAQLSGASLSGVLSAGGTSDSVTLGNASAGTFNDKNVGNGKPVSTAMNISGTDVGNYTLKQPTALSADINALGITVDAAGIDKIYDASNPANVSLTSAGVVAGDEVSFSDSSAAFVSPNAGDAIAVNVSGITASGSNAGNYTLLNTTASATANITPAVLNLTATRVYDASTDATALLFGSKGMLNGVAGQQLTLGGKGTLSSKNVGSQKTFTADGLDGFTLTGVGSALAGNYTLANGTDWVTITRAQLVVNDATVATRSYDGAVDAAISGATLVGVLGSDDVVLGNETSGSFDTKNAGSGKAVTTAMTAGGGDATNYTLVQPNDLTGTIDPLTITVAATAHDKTYDGSDASTLSSLGSSGVLSGDIVSFAGTGARFADANAGVGRTVTVSGVTASGRDAGNYSFSNTASTIATINQAVLDLTASRVYDGTTNAAASLFGSNGTLAGVSGETLTLGGSGALSSRKVGSQQPFARDGLDGFTLTGNGSALAGNYVLAGGTDWVSITPLAVTVVATAQNKTYDGSNVAALTSLGSTGLLSGDDVNFADTKARFADANAGVDKTVTVSGITSSGADAGNYSFSNTATTTAIINQAVLNLTASRVYDGTSNAAASRFGNEGTLAGVNGETLTLGGSGTLSSRNVESQQPFASSGLGGFTLTGNGSALARNYVLAGGTDWVSITPLAITVAATAHDKSYDGSSTATLTSLGSSDVLSGDAVNFAATEASFADANAGTGRTVTVSGITASGTDAGNYSFINTTSTTATINQAVLNLTASRVYDGTSNAAASLFGSNGALAGVKGETLTLGGVGTLSTRNVGSQNPFATNGLSAFALSGNNGALVSNYTFAGGTDWVTVTPATLSVVGTVAADRVYDGTTSATLSGATLAGLFGGDNVTLASTGLGTFADKNAGNGKAVSTAMTINGTDSANYVLAQPGGVVADITPLAIQVDASAGNKVYDGNADARASLSSSGVLDGDDVDFSASSASFANKSAGTGKTVTAQDITDSGTDAPNYLLLNTTATALANITPLAIQVDASAGNKVYDGNADARASLTSSGVIDGDNVNFSASSASFANKNAGTGKTVTARGITDSGADAPNYLLLNTTTTALANITPLHISVSATGTDKVYDGNALDPVTLGSAGVLSGDQVSFSYDSAMFDNPNADLGKPVSVAGVSLAGDDAKNYQLLDNATTTRADITPRPISVTAVGISKPYDGNRLAQVTLGSTGVLRGDQVAFSDGSALFNTADAGTAKPITVSGIAATGTDADNYVVSDTQAAAVADITPRATPANRISNSWIAQVQAVLGPNAIATPYGLARTDSNGVFTGNQKKKRRLTERNGMRADFRSGLNVQVQGAGVRLPGDTAP